MAEKLPDRKTAPEQESLVTELDGRRKHKYGSYKYQPEYDKIAIDLLSTDECKTKAHLCRALQCSKPLLLKWMREHESFRQAVEDGLELGSAKWREKIRDHAFEPTKEVNNGLIKLLSANVYGIREETDPLVVVNNNIDTDPETLMKNRGIPIPKVDVEDLDEDEVDAD